ncbi:hypothetical protein B0T16DRAFT_156693 [Cercophora newfieldiana]|uniref:Uncharacterized protein n=1 Tax=Cercophora newfieldiana TaxID=92897 RepID=A0AA40CP97_9PEZI|nr:hypothetical protein B0T16DRAFT_156693 [Cercophora newfieldiana]
MQAHRPGHQLRGDVRACRVFLDCVDMRGTHMMLVSSRNSAPGLCAAHHYPFHFLLLLPTAARDWLRSGRLERVVSGQCRVLQSSLFKRSMWPSGDMGFGNSLGWEFVACCNGCFLGRETMDTTRRWFSVASPPPSSLTLGRPHSDDVASWFLQDHQLGCSRIDQAKPHERTLCRRHSVANSRRQASGCGSSRRHPSPPGGLLILRVKLRRSIWRGRFSSRVPHSDPAFRVSLRTESWARRSYSRFDGGYLGDCHDVVFLRAGLLISRDCPGDLLPCGSSGIALYGTTFLSLCSPWFLVWPSSALVATFNIRFCSSF